MNISRRSFLKLAAVSTAAVAVAASMTGCSSVFKPNVSVILQEKKGDAGYAFTGDQSNLLADKTIWKDGKKVASSEDVSLVNVGEKTKDMSLDDAKKLVEDNLKKDYKMDNKKVVLESTETLEFKAKDPSHYELTIVFTVSNN